MSWQDIDRLFHAAAALAPADRAAFLDNECNGDALLRAQLEGMLAADDQAERLIEGIVLRGGASLAAVTPHPLQGARLGPYEIVREIGRGGRGEVFLARRADREFEKQVAVKLVRAGLDTEARRFLQERQILARLEHPNVARLLDGGATPDGRPYLVMEYVDGVPITAYCAAHKLSAEECCRLFLAVCAAVEYAHRNLIVHRDIKPGNILVDEAGTPKLLDFGIAKLLESEGGETTAAARPLTPHYASPEQISGAAITTATDVYMLGEVLFELLTGRRAHRISSTAPGELERVICLTPVERPSEARPEWRKKLAGDLDNIVLRALHKDPQRRYGSVEQLADDLRRYLEGRPVKARPDTLGYRFRKLVGRYPATASVAALLVISIGLGVASTVRQKRLAERRFNDVRQMANVFLFDFERAIRDVPGTAEARQLVIRTGLQYMERLSRESAGNPALQRELAGAYVKMGELQGGPTIISVSNTSNAAGARESYSRAVQLFRSLDAARSPDVDLRCAYISALSVYALKRMGIDLQGALRDAREALDVAEDLNRAHPGNRQVMERMAGAAQNLAWTHQRTDLNAAIANGRKALGLWEELVRRFPGDPALRADLATMWLRLSMLHAGLPDWPKVGEEAGHAAEILEPLHAANPADLTVAKLLMITYGNVGKGLFVADTARGLAYLRKAVDLADQIHAGDPNSMDALADVTGIHSVYGYRLSQSGDYRGAQPYLDRAAAAAETLAKRDPADRGVPVTWAILITYVARNLENQGDLAGAIRHRRRADDLLEASHRGSPKDTHVLSLLTENLGTLARICMDNGDSAEAVRHAHRTLELVEWFRKEFPGNALLERFGRSAKTAEAVVTRANPSP